MWTKTILGATIGIVGWSLFRRLLSGVSSGSPVSRVEPRAEPPPRNLVYLEHYREHRRQAGSSGNAAGETELRAALAAADRRARRLANRNRPAA